MANVKNGNTWYIDTAGTLTSDKDQVVVYVILRATAANAVLVLSDPTLTGNPKKIEFGEATQYESPLFPFEEVPLRFPNGIRVETLTNCNATLVLKTIGG